jgi:hypothetical protein
MSTAINITVNDGGLPVRNRQQVAANRQAFVQNVATEKSTALGIDQRSQDRIAQGRDPATGALLIPPSSTGALGVSGGNIPRLNQQPAANRRLTEEYFYLFRPDSGPISGGAWSAKGNGIQIPSLLIPDPELEETLGGTRRVNTKPSMLSYGNNSLIADNAMINSTYVPGVKNFTYELKAALRGNAVRTIKPQREAREVIIEAQVLSPPHPRLTLESSGTFNYVLIEVGLFQILRRSSAQVSFSIGNPGGSGIPREDNLLSLILTDASLSVLDAGVSLNNNNFLSIKLIVSKKSLNANVYLDNVLGGSFQMSTETRDSLLTDSSPGLVIEFGAATTPYVVNVPVTGAEFGGPTPYTAGVSAIKNLKITWRL